MSWFGGGPSASKSQNLKRYGGVEKMYIHFYTFTWGGTSDVQLFWYSSNTENLNLFLDYKYIFTTLKKYGSIDAYTGDVFTIKGLAKFKEQLILLGIKDETAHNLTLRDRTTIELYASTTEKITEFNDLFDICFENYEFVNSFSSENELSKKRIEVEIEPSGPAGLEPQNNNSFIKFSFLNNDYIIPYYNLNLYPYEVIKSRVGNVTLNNWFNAMIKKKDGYYNAVMTLFKVCEFNKESGVAGEGDGGAEEGDGAADDDNTTVVTMSGRENKIHPVEWVKLFCDLYLEEATGHDILLSDIYQSYLTASGWTDTPTMSMSSFIKKLRALNRFTIKRRSKGMMAIGWRCLVPEQADMYQSVRSGNNYSRQMLQYTPIIELYPMIPTDSTVLDTYGHKYAREAIILLKRTGVPINYQTIAQFCSIPQISAQLPFYADYIDGVIEKYKEMYKQLAAEKKKNSIHDQTLLQTYRDFTTKCTIYFPFSSNLYDSSKSGINTSIASPAISMGDVVGFNELFGMFTTSKQYHLYEVEKGTPQEYNNALGTELDIGHNRILPENFGERVGTFNTGTKLAVTGSDIRVMGTF
jgi:hypothetical protein